MLSDEELLELFYKRFIQLKEENQLTLTEISNATGIGLSSLSQYEHKRREPKWSQIVKLTEYFHVSADYLMGLSNERRYKPNGSNKASKS